MLGVFGATVVFIVWVCLSVAAFIIINFCGPPPTAAATTKSWAGR